MAKYRTATAVLAGLGLLLTMVLMTPFLAVGVEPEAEKGCTPVGSGLFTAAYGGSGAEFADAVVQASGDGYVVAGSTASGSTTPQDAWVVKLNKNGSAAWDRRYLVAAHEAIADIQRTPDGGYVVAGTAESTASGINRSEAWVYKLKSNGNLVWDKIYIGTNDGSAQAVQPLAGGGYIVAAIAHELGTMTQLDPWVLKLKGDGSVAWEKTWYGTGWDVVQSIQSISGDYVAAGSTNSFGAGSFDAWVLKLAGDGGLIWQKTYGGSGADHAYDLQPTDDGGFIVAGDTRSYGAGQGDAWVLKLNSDGGVAWQKAYGGPLRDEASAIRRTSDGGYVLAGETETEDRPYGDGPLDAWLLKLNGDGSVAWSKAYGGPEHDWLSSVEQASDGGYVAAGTTYSYGGGSSDIWVLKVDAGGSLCQGCPLGRTFEVTVTETTAAPATSTATIGENSATAVDSGAGGQDTDTRPDHACACGLSLCKAVAPESEVAYHGPVSYSVVLSNSMDLDAADVWLTDTLPAEVAFGTWLERPPGAQMSADRLTWHGTVTAQQLVSLRYTADHVGDYGDVVTNTATFSHATAAGNATAAFSVEGPLAIEKTVTPAEGVAYHGTVAYSIVVRNVGQEAAEGLVVSDNLPGEVVFSHWLETPPSGASVDGGELSWSGVLSGSAEFELNFATIHTGQRGDVVTNTATFHHSTGSGSDSATFVVKAGYVVYLPTILKDAGP